MAKRVYFVRHGESEANAARVHQGSTEPLSPRGREQARAVAQRVAGIDFDILISSPYVRALETARIISAATGKEIVQNELFSERKKPSEQIGMSHRDTQELDRLYFEAWLKGGRYKDGDTFQDLVVRARKAIAFLESIPEETVVVVTHGIFLKVICAVILLGEYIEPKTCDRLIWLLRMENTGITEIEMRDQGWVIETWNDQAHLGDSD